MRRTALILFCVLLCAGCGRTDFRDLDFPDKGFSISLPSEWNIRIDYKGADVMALIQDKRFSRPYRENLNIIYEKHDSPVDLDDYISKQVSSLQNNRLLKNCVIEKNGTVSLDSIEVPWYLYRYRIGGFTVRSVSYVVSSGTRVYIITGVTEYAEYQKYKQTFEKIVKSIDIHR